MYNILNLMKHLPHYNINLKKRLK